MVMKCSFKLLIFFSVSKKIKTMKIYKYLIQIFSYCKNTFLSIKIVKIIFVIRKLNYIISIKYMCITDINLI